MNSAKNTVGAMMIASGIFAAHSALAQPPVSMIQYCAGAQCIYNSTGGVVGEPKGDGILFRQILTGSFPGWYQMGFNATGMTTDAVLIYATQNCTGQPYVGDIDSIIGAGDDLLAKVAQYDGQRLWAAIAPAETVEWHSVYFFSAPVVGCQPGCPKVGCSASLSLAGVVESTNYYPPFKMQ
jgi:hypothetical protein